MEQFASPAKGEAESLGSCLRRNDTPGLSTAKGERVGIFLPSAVFIPVAFAGEGMLRRAYRKGLAGFADAGLGGILPMQPSVFFCSRRRPRFQGAS